MPACPDSLGPQSERVSVHAVLALCACPRAPWQQSNLADQKKVPEAQAPGDPGSKSTEGGR